MSPNEVSSRPGPAPPIASREISDRSANRSTRLRSGTYSPKGTRWALSYRSDNPVAGAPQSISGPAKTPGGKFTAITAGDYHSCGLRADGAVVCWGSGATPTASLDIKGVTMVSAGGAFTCGLLTDQTIDCWAGKFSAIGNVPNGTFQAVSSGSAHACGLRTDGTIKCWGGLPGVFGGSTGVIATG